ncbi:hypothetical protein ACFYXL_33050 [Streptomyces tsukubensis]|uniref:hypothetical protein n=1 Tax=Streptomyces tsukubensis TaxID=83656 RepID=UPI0036BD25C2
MSFHVITDETGTEWVGPADYERADQVAVLPLFRDWSDAFALHPNNQAGAVAYMLNRMPRPTARDASYAQYEQERHFTNGYRAFKASYASHARHKEGPKPPPQQVDAPVPLPEAVIPGQRKEMMDPETGELVTAVVLPEKPDPETAPQVDPIAVLVNAARSHCFETITRNGRHMTALEQAGDRDAVAAAMRQEKERKDQLRDLTRETRRLRGYFDVLELVAAAHPRYPAAQSVEEIVRAEQVDLSAHGLNYKKLREFLAAFSTTVAA